jgi:hypothetical protein
MEVWEKEEEAGVPVEGGRKGKRGWAAGSRHTEHHVHTVGVPAASNARSRCRGPSPQTEGFEGAKQRE